MERVRENGDGDGMGERREEERRRASNIRFKLSNWISATEALGSGPKFAKRARNANRDGEDRDRAERIGLFERSLDFQSRWRTCCADSGAACNVCDVPRHFICAHRPFLRTSIHTYNYANDLLVPLIARLNNVPRSPVYFCTRDISLIRWLIISFID